MKFYGIFAHLKSRTLLTLFGLVVLTLALFLSRGEQLSWAAPEQNPAMQTVPPRATPTPEDAPPDVSQPPDAPPPRSTPPDKNDNSAGPDDDDPSSDQPLAGDDDGGGGNNGDTPLSNQPSDDNQNNSPSSPNPQDSSDSQTGDSDDQPQDETSPPDAPGSAEDKGNTFDPAQSADLSLLKTVGNPAVAIGQVLTYTIVVSNSGPSNAHNVIVREVLPAGLVLRSIVVSQGSYNASSGLWDVGLMVNGQRVTMSLVTIAAEAGPVTNQAEIFAVVQADPDSIPNNRLEQEDDQDHVSITITANADRMSGADDELAEVAQTGPAGEASTLPTTTGAALLYWVLALVGGVMFIFIGIFLVRRS